MKSLSLVLPVWNEASFIAKVVHDLEKILETHQVDYELLLVENGSTDRSLDLVRDLSRQNHRCRVVVRPKGYGSAVQGGLLEAKREWVAYMPSDGQIKPSVLIELLEKMESGSYDLVKINRVARESRVRKVISFCFNLLTRLLFRLNVNDINGSPKLFRREAVPLLSLKSQGNLIDTELMAKAKALGWKVGEVETEVLPRAGGKSHVNLSAILTFIKELLALRFSPDLKEFRTKVSSELLTRSRLYAAP